MLDELLKHTRQPAIAIEPGVAVRALDELHQKTEELLAFISNDGLGG